MKEDKGADSPQQRNAASCLLNLFKIKVILTLKTMKKLSFLFILPTILIGCINSLEETVSWESVSQHQHDWNELGMGECV
ncbi:MAG: hypothetical protein IJX44_05485 [Bacteroidaceae bacterium]|nr:hypothetical protein [Bacteroidaceae bacterium]